MTDDSTVPLYSLVMVGRNDSYNPDFLYRLQTTLNFNARAVEKIGRFSAVEIVVVDWGSTVPLREVLALEEPAAFSTSFVELSPETAAQYSEAPSGMHGPRATNAGIRRAKGQFVGIQGADLLMTNASWQALLSVLEDRRHNLLDLSKSYLQIPRRQVPWSFVARQPSLDQWERWLLTCDKAAAEHRGSSPSTGGGMGALILHRNLWHDVRGLEESFSGWGYSDTDLALRISPHYSWIDAGTYGVMCYKMQHAPGGHRGRLLKGGNIGINRPWITTTLSSRYIDWGLPHLALEAKKAKPQGEHCRSFQVEQARDNWSKELPKSVEQFFDKDVCSHVSRALGRAWKFDVAELEMLQALSWFGLRKFPMNYLEIGLRHHLYVRAVSTACPSADIYVLEPVEKDSEGAPPETTDIAMKLLWDWRHKGYFRVSLGDLLSNFGRLKQSFIGPFQLEVVMFKLEQADHMQLLAPVLEAIVPGGLLAFQAARVDLLDAAIEACISQVPHAHVVCGHSGRTAFMFISKKDTPSSELVTFPKVSARLPRVRSLKMLSLRATVLGRQLHFVLSRLDRRSTWRSYWRLIVSKTKRLK
jgi:hypothetical protein